MVARKGAGERIVAADALDRSYAVNVGLVFGVDRRFVRSREKQQIFVDRQTPFRGAIECGIILRRPDSVQIWRRFCGSAQRVASHCGSTDGALGLTPPSAAPADMRVRLNSPFSCSTSRSSLPIRPLV